MPLRWPYHTGPNCHYSGFIGYLVAGVVGAITAAFAVFAPLYFLVLIGAPYYRRFATVPQVKAFLQGVRAAAVGAIAGAAYILARRSMIDLPTMLIAIVTFAILSRTKKIPEPVLVVAAGIVGVLLRGDLR
jgi:chromate transporter